MEGVGDGRSDKWPVWEGASARDDKATKPTITPPIP